MRLVSLVPAATEWIAAFGVGGRLVGRSHACDAPAGIEAVPALTEPAFAADGSAAALDDAVREAAAAGDALFHLDADRLRALAPTHVVVQDQCAVCAVAPDQLAEALDGLDVTVIPWAPMTFKQALMAALDLGRTLGRLPEAMAVLGNAERALLELRQRLGARREGTIEGRPAPRCAVVEWVEPLMTAGHWTPDLVRLAGGEPVGAEPGVASRYVERAAIETAEVLVVAACGRTVAQALDDLAAVDWADLPAVQAGRVFVLDGDAFVNRPGPRLYRSIELVAAALHPDRADVAFSDAEMVRWGEVPV